MPGINLPPDRGSLVSNTELDRFTNPSPSKEFHIKPDDDAAKLPSGHVRATKPGAFNATNTKPSVETPVEFVSIATTSEDAPSHGANLPTDLHRDGWLSRSQPHVSTESQGGQKPPKQTGR